MTEATDTPKPRASRPRKTPLKNTEADRKVEDQVNEKAAEELRQFADRDEQLAAEAADVAARRRANMAEAKAKGYDTTALRAALKARAIDPEKRARDRAEADFYLELIGL